MPKQTMLVLLAGGYSTRLGFPKQYLRDKDGYLFEKIVANIPADIITIITNNQFHIFWFDYIKSKKFGKQYNLFVENHSEPDKAFGPLYYLTTEILSYFHHHVDNLVISPIDCYFDSFSFVKSLMSTTNGIVVSRCPEAHLRHVGTCIVKGSSLEAFYEKQQISKTGFFDRRWVFTGLIKTTMENLMAVSPISEKTNLGSLIPIYTSHDKNWEVIKYKGLYRDVGIPATMEELINKGKILSPVSV